MARELLGRFIKLQYIRDAESLLDIDYTNPSVQLSNHQLRLGFATTQFIKSEDLEGTLAMQRFYEEVRDFFTTALNYIKDKFPYNDIVVNYAIVC